MKHIKTLILAIALILVNFSFNLKAENVIDINITVSKNYAAVDEEITVNVELSSELRGSATLELQIEGPGRLSQKKLAFQEVQSSSRSVTLTTTDEGLITITSIVSDAYALNGQSFDKAVTNAVEITVSNQKPKQVAETKPVDDTPIYTPAVKSSNVDLKSLTVDKGQLVPSFSNDIVDYHLILPIGENSVTINAEAYDSRSSVKGIGEISLEDGKNLKEQHISVEAENGAIKTFKIIITKDVAADKFIELNTIDGKKEKFGFLNAAPSTLVLPTSFLLKEIDFKGQKVSAYINDGYPNDYLFYLEDSQKNKNLYYYSSSRDMIHKIQATKINNKFYGLADIYQDFKLAENKTLKFDNIEVKGVKFNQGGNTNNFYIINALNEKGKFELMQFDQKNATISTFFDNQKQILQLTEENDKLVNSKFILLASVVCLALLLIIIIIVFISFVAKAKAKIRNLENN